MTLFFYMHGVFLVNLNMLMGELQYFGKTNMIYAIYVNEKL